MATIIPFRALRPVPNLASQVAALPYDVMDEAEARAICAKESYSFLHIDRSETAFPPGTDPDSPAVYEKAAEILTQWTKEGILQQDSHPCLYLYRLTRNGKSQTGLVCCTSVEEYDNGILRKHELTRAEKEAGRTRHVNACNAQTGPIFMAYRQSSATAMMADWAKTHDPEVSFTSDDGIGHAVWVIDDPNAIANFTDAIAADPNLYIADGHHRCASAAAVCHQRLKQQPDAPADAPFRWILSVLFPADELTIMDYNRLVKDTNGLTADELFEKISESFYLLPWPKPGPCRPMMPHQFGMYFEQKWYLLTAQEDAIADDPVGRLDVSILQNRLLGPILGIQDPRTDKRIDFVGGIRGLGELEKRVILSEGKIAFSLYPTSMEELMNVADQGLIMPPKSTWFEPKLRSGLFIHVLSDH